MVMSLFHVFDTKQSEERNFLNHFSKNDQLLENILTSAIDSDI